MIVNMNLGHQFLQKEFGVRPRVGWMIDSFGHSTSNAALYADFGFDAIFMSREASDLRMKRFNEGHFDFIWKPLSKHFGNQKEIYSSFFVPHYNDPPDTLHNDIERTDNDAFQDDPTLQEFNALKKATAMINNI